MDSQKYPANVPPELIDAFEASGSAYRALARNLGVNPAHVHNLLVHGIEPTDKDIRKKLLLPARNMENVPAWVMTATSTLQSLEQQAAPSSNRLYNRRGKRVR